MGVNPNVGTDGLSEVESCPRHAPGLTIGSQAVNGHIGTSTAPAQAMNLAIGRILSTNQGEGAHQLAGFIL